MGKQLNRTRLTDIHRLETREFDTLTELALEVASRGLEPGGAILDIVDTLDDALEWLPVVELDLEGLDEELAGVLRPFARWGFEG
jgi:hypothetical protein